MRHLNLYLVGSILLSAACGARSDLDTLTANVGAGGVVDFATATLVTTATATKVTDGSTNSGGTSTSSTTSTAGATTGGSASTGGSTNTRLVAKLISTGSKHTCAVLSGCSVQCWGWNEYGQLGNGTTTDSNVPITVTSITNALAVAAGIEHTCALLSGGSVQCWGDNDLGQLGNGTTTIACGGCGPTPVQVSSITLLPLGKNTPARC